MKKERESVDLVGDSDDENAEDESEQKSSEQVVKAKIAAEMEAQLSLLRRIPLCLGEMQRNVPLAAFQSLHRTRNLIE